MPLTLFLTLLLAIPLLGGPGILECNEGRFAAAVAVLRNEGPSGRSALAACLNNAAEQERTTGSLKAAEAYARESLELSSEAGDRLLEGHARNTLAHVLHDASQLAHARQEYLAAIRIRRNTGPAASLASTLTSYSSLLLRTGELSAAESAGLEAVEILRATNTDHPWLSTAANNLAQIYRMQHRYAEAEPLYREAIRLAVRHYGPNSRNAALLQKNFADYYREIGRTQASIAMLQRASQAANSDRVMALR